MFNFLTKFELFYIGFFVGNFLKTIFWCCFCWYLFKMLKTTQKQKIVFFLNVLNIKILIFFVRIMKFYTIGQLWPSMNILYSTLKTNNYHIRKGSFLSFATVPNSLYFSQKMCVLCHFKRCKVTVARNIRITANSKIKHIDLKFTLLKM